MDDPRGGKVDVAEDDVQLIDERPKYVEQNNNGERNKIQVLFVDRTRSGAVHFLFGRR